MASHGDNIAKSYIDYYLILLADGDLWKDEIAELFKHAVSRIQSQELDNRHCPVGLYFGFLY